jgi:hypothetical protein
VHELLFELEIIMYLVLVCRSPFLPELSPSSITSDLTDLLEEACLPGSVSDVAIQVSMNY